MKHRHMRRIGSVLLGLGLSLPTLADTQLSIGGAEINAGGSTTSLDFPLVRDELGTDLYIQYHQGAANAAPGAWRHGGTAPAVISSFKTIGVRSPSAD